MDIHKFINNSGFKVLAMARLSSCEYSIVFYLMNCSASGINQIITNESELASLMGYEIKNLREALLALAKRQIIVLSYKDVAIDDTSYSICLGFQFDVSIWALNYKENATPQDAIVYPFMRDNKSKSHLKLERPIIDGRSHWERVIHAYTQGRSLSDEEVIRDEQSAQTLCETHPIEHLLMIINHFGVRIQNLSLLASSWQHYQEIFEEETQKVDIMEARKKHQDLDDQLKKSSQFWLDKADEKKLTEEEISVLKLLLHHRHPRRQLFWAFQARDRYTNLTNFFEENNAIMLGITTSGVIVKKPTHPN